MRQIKVFRHFGQLYQYPYYDYDTNAEEIIKDWKDKAIPLAKDADADHFIYCTKIFDSEEQLTEIHLYTVALTDEEFQKRTEMQTKVANCWIGAWHKGVSY